MRPARGNTYCASWALLSLCLLAGALIATGQPTQEELPDSATTTPSPAADSSIFDFSNYIKLFNRVYESKVEQMARSYYFSVQAIRVFISAVKYRHGEQLYYFAINWLSDASPEELDMMENKVMDSETDPEPDQLREAPVDDVEPMDSSDDIEADLRQLANDNQDEPAFRELGEFLGTAGELKRRHKRAASDKKLRYLPNEKLINTGSNVKLDPEVQAKMTKRVPSNNPAHKPIELSSNGLINEQKEVYYYFDLPVMDWLDSAVQHVKHAFVHDVLGQKSGKERGDDELPDEVFVDLRESTKCFLPPRSQGHCGSCYAFAATTIAEWLYCMQTGQLVAFSEQYMVDCGSEYMRKDGLKGCAGGNRMASAKFIHNFGLELLSDYPYIARNGTCPFYEDEPLKTTGYIRTKMPSVFQVSLKQIPRLLKHGPMYVSIKTDRSFHAYGGGVHAIPCPDKEPGSRHGVVLVGHGRENGREYWLIRNSHGLSWGEDGYYKLDKSAKGLCGSFAYAFATKNGHKSKIRAYVNPDHPKDRIQRKPKRQLKFVAPFPKVYNGDWFISQAKKYPFDWLD